MSAALFGEGEADVNNAHNDWIPRCKEGDFQAFQQIYPCSFPENDILGKEEESSSAMAPDRPELNLAIPRVKMRRAYRRMWQAVPCTSKRTLGTESQKDIEEILKGKLATIMEEEPKPLEEFRHVLVMKKGRKLWSKGMQIFLPRFSLRGSYALLTTGFASKRSLTVLLQKWINARR